MHNLVHLKCRALIYKYLEPELVLDKGLCFDPHVNKITNYIIFHKYEASSCNEFISTQFEFLTFCSDSNSKLNSESSPKKQLSLASLYFKTISV